LESSECYPPPLKPDSASQANFQALSTQLGDSCSAPILEPERSALLQEALADSQLQAVKAQLEGRGLGMNADEAQAVRLVGGEQLVIPFGQDAHLVWTRTNGQTAAVGLIRQGNKTLNVGADGQERVVRVLSAQQAEKLLRKLREKGKFQDFEGKLAQKGKRVGKVRVLLDETNKIAILGIAAEGDEKIGHQVRIKVKANKYDEPEDDAEPAIQATACGQATGEAVPTGARMQPLALPSGGGDFEGGYEGPQICTSQWGYDYLCLSRTPSVSLSTTSLTLPQTFINQQVQASFTIWNGGGGTLAGTVSAPAPFSIVSGGSFSLLPGQPQEVVVRFSSGTAGSFSKSIAISSNGGSKTVTATSVAHKVSFFPAQVDFGSGLFVLREQCDDTGGCKLRTEKVGLPIEKTLTVKNEGTVAVSLTLSTTAPYKIVSVLPTLSPGQSAQVTLRFDPSESGSFTGNVQVGINGGQGSVSSPPLVGVAHKIEIDPAVLDFGIVFVGSTRERKLTVKNQGVTKVTLEAPNTTQNTTSPFKVMMESPLVLGPSESKEVSVQFRPTVSGSYAQTMQLFNGSNYLEISLFARAYTYTEYIRMVLSFNNAIAQAWQYPLVRIRDSTKDLVLTGFAQLNEEIVQQFEAAADALDNVSQPTDPQLEQFYQAIGAIPIEDIQHWFELLAEAEKQGAFEETYNNLLPQGLSYLEEALSTLLAGLDSEYQRTVAKEAIKATAQQWAIISEQIIWQDVQREVINLLKKVLVIRHLMPELIFLIPADMLPEPLKKIAGYLDPYETVHKFAEEWTLTATALEQYSSYFGNTAAMDFSKAIKTLISQYINAMLRSGYGISEWWVLDLLDYLTEFLNWMRGDLSKLERGYGTIVVAGNLSSNLAELSWEFSNLLHERYGYGDWWGIMMRFKDTDGKKGIAIVGGDACHNCADKAQEIAAWIGEAVKQAQRFSHIWGIEKEIVVFAFTYPGADGIDAVINALLLSAGDSTTPIILTWTDSYGQVWYTCIGACSNLNKRTLQKIACASQGKASSCGAKEFLRGGATAPPPSSLSPAALVTPG
jgi:hypothetical protein